jgi:hypothetical protein
MPPPLARTEDESSGVGDAGVPYLPSVWGHLLRRLLAAAIMGWLRRVRSRRSGVRVGTFALPPPLLERTTP